MLHQIAISLLFLGIAAPALAEDEKAKSATEARIAAEIARLGNSNKSECAAAVEALVKIGKPAAAALVKALSDPCNDVRAFAARPCGAFSPLILPMLPITTTRHFGDSVLLNSSQGWRWARPLKSCCQSFRLSNDGTHARAAMGVAVNSPTVIGWTTTGWLICTGNWLITGKTPSTS